MESVTLARMRRRYGHFVIINWSDLLTTKNKLGYIHQLKENVMKTELELALAELINKANNGIDSATGFLQAEIPDIIEQLLMWHGIYNLFMFVIGLLVAVAWLVIEVKVLNWGRNNKWHVDDWLLGYIFCGSFIRLIPFITVCCLINLIWLQIWIAPKVWLLEYASKLTGN